MSAERGNKGYDDLLTADRWANTHYPQMFGPKTLAFGLVFLECFLEGKMSLQDFQFFYPDSSKREELVKLTDKVHLLYGRTMTVDPERLMNVFEKTQKGVIISLKCLLGQADLDVFFENRSNNEHIKEAQELFDAGIDILHSDRMIRLSEEYKESLREPLTKGFASLSPGKKRDLKKYLRTVEDAVEATIIDAVGAKNRRLSNPFDNYPLTLFLTRVAREGSKISFMSRL